MSDEGVLRRRVREWLSGLGIEANDLKTYIQALTHRSFARQINVQSRGNEQLEFLGDSVLSFIITSYLYKNFSHFTEGRLAKIRAILVNRDTLSKIARNIGLNLEILLSENEEACDGREKDSILADGMEAFIGAIYIDMGIKFTTAWVLKHYEEKIEKNVSTPRISDYKTYLQESIQADFSKLAHYKVVKVEGPDHDRTFHSVVMIDDKIAGRGKGSSKKESEQKAAKDTLKSLYNLDL
ncbi:MAG: ribonuclease III [Actinobacteria bacterium]|nr:ribonuclease III [Actinomycetota bacterium]